MSRARCAVSLLLLLGLLTGCAALDLPRFARLEGTELLAQVDRWVEEREYGRALDALSRADPKDPQYPQLAERRREVEALAAAYEQEVLSNVRSDVEAGNWAGALDRFDQALERLPDSAALRDGLAELHRQQAARIGEVRSEILVHRARWLRASLPLYAKIARIAPRDDTAQERLARHQEEVEEVARELMEQGLAAFEEEDYARAEQFLPLAASLSDAPEVAEAHAKLKAWRSRQREEQEAERHRRQEAAQARREAERRRIERLWQEYDSAFEAKEYNAARNRVERLGELLPKDEAVAQARARLEAAVASAVERLFDQGVSLYSRGRFEEAIERWQRVLELESGHQSAQESLERAQRVMRRVEHLREDEAGGETEGQPAPE